MSKPWDALGELSSDSEADAGEAEGGPRPSDEAPPPAKPVDVDFEALRRAGYRSGPSVLYVPEPEPAQQTSWAWGDGRDGRAERDAHVEDLAEREATRAAANEAVEAAAIQGRLAAAHRDHVRSGKRQEALELKQEKGGKRKVESWNKKEQRKRERGQASDGKDYVQEEKRIQRQFGVTSGFDQ